MRNKAYSLFGRLTGAGNKARQARNQDEESQSRGNAPAQPRIEPSLDRSSSRPASEEPAQQPSFTGMEPKEHASSSKEDEELLDIPAFLRRQAN
ncbi:hypothetical protein [Fodinicurvata halophila]